MDTKPVSTNSALVAAETTPDNMFLFPTSFAQQRLWFLNQLTPGSPAYNISLTPRLKGVLDFVAFERSLEEIVRRHEILHTSFALENGQPVQVVAPARPLKVAVQDLRRLSESDREKEALRRMTEEALRPFDLSRGPLLRVLLLQLGAEEHILVLTMHHIVSDGWSVQVMLRELSTLYGAFREGRPSPLPSLSIQYADFAVWQRDWLKDGAVSDQLGYWKKQLLGAATLELPTNRARPAVHSFRGGWQALELSRELTEALRQLSQREGATLFMSLVAAFQALLHRYCQQDDISLGTPIANRNRVELEGLIGFFANTLVLRTDLSGDPSFRALLRRVRKVTVDAYKSQDVPFERLVEELQPDRDLSRNPLFQVSLALQSDPLGELVLPGLVVTSVWPQASTTKVDLEVYLFEVFGGIQGWFVYSSDLFDRETIARMVRAFGIILKGIAADPERPISELPLLDDTERQEILVQWNETACEFPEDQCIHHLFELQARSNSEATAAIFEDQRISYGELNRRANQVAHCLSQRGVGPDVLVGLCVERSLELLVGLLGILKAGGAYVPLDPSYPPERLSFMIDDSNARVLLTQRQAAASLPSHNADVVYLDADWESIAKQSVDNPDVRITSRNLAYVIYTSGSTGTPKGALIEHRGLRSVAEAQFRIFNLQPDSRVLQFASLSFDASIFEIVMAIRAGGTLCLARPESLLPGPALAELLRTRAITHVTLPPSALAAIPVEDLPTLRTITVAGEACPAELVAPWAKQRRFFNLYGPTEATIWATFAECFDSSRRPPIGRPIPGTQVYVLDQHRKPVPIGVTGELYIGGMGLARGYHNRPELTAEHFIRNPFSHHLDARLYKTGDRVRYLPDGNLEFLGRLDHQVKVRGFRIELREIEEWLRRHSDVRRGSARIRQARNGWSRTLPAIPTLPWSSSAVI